MASRDWLRTVIATLLGYSSIINAQSPPGAIPPAQTLVPETTAANGPLLGSERIQLTDAIIDRIASNEATSSIANLFAFDHNGTTVNRNTACKTFPGDALWPSQSNWDIFDALLNDGLVPTVPIASPCYNSKWGAKDIAKCNNVVNNFTKYPLQ